MGVVTFVWPLQPFSPILRYIPRVVSILERGVKVHLDSMLHDPVFDSICD